MYNPIDPKYVYKEKNTGSIALSLGFMYCFYNKTQKPILHYTTKSSVM